MKVIEISGKLRESIGKTNAKKLRRAKSVPCVLYGGKENIHFQAEESDFRPIIFSPNSYLLKLNIEGKTYDAILKDTQYHPLRDNLIHADFYEIFEDKKIVTQVPVTLFGFSKGVKAGGKLQLIARKLKVKALPKNLPDNFEINVEDLELGKSIKVGELQFENIELLDPKNAVVASVKLTRAAKGLAAAESAQAGEIK